MQDPYMPLKNTDCSAESGRYWYCLICQVFSPFPNNPWFTQPYKRTLLEKEEMLVTSTFSSSHHVFFPITDRNSHLSNTKAHSDRKC